MPQGPIPTFPNLLTPSKTTKPANGDARGNLQVSGVGGTNSALYITAATVVKASPGMVIQAIVQVAGSGTGTINDCVSTAAVATGNQVAVLPETVGPIKLEFPCLNGITVTPGTSQAVSISYQ